ncbi:LacI family DNA-binding transcriptional regulator [Uliginosibacterium gangwonense]|uniref:LacI family DNA-binding transcriptional regulator n=1 Tax=Uliginosibacterium gangwonense TaxID=392736 RepID=UPI00146E90EA|nr:LacI family DNA-binding transcriptional regulator [Uliginosibacterium gangwonense]
MSSDTPAPSPNTAVTMQDVADAAGLSRTTVSKYFNGSTSLKASTRTLIERTCADLHYVPDLHAVSLVKGRSQLIGVVLPVIADAFYGEVLRHMDEMARAAGQQLVVLCSHNDAAIEEAALRTLRAMKVRGAVVTAVASDRNRALYASLEAEMRIVFLDSYVQADCNFVMNDNVQSMTLLVDYLLERGHAPAYLSAPAVARPSHDERLLGYTQAMQRAGQRPRIIPANTGTLSWDFEAYALQTVSQWLASGEWLHDKIGALVCATDRLALGAMAAFRRIGKTPGQDILFAGHDDVPMCEYIHPALTTARQDLAAIGQAAIECLLQPDKQKTRYQRRFPASLVIRDSA